MARFCTKCGRPLADGEICTCQQSAEQNIANPAAAQDAVPPREAPKTKHSKQDAVPPEALKTETTLSKPETENEMPNAETFRPEPRQPVQPTPEQAHQVPPSMNQTQTNQSQVPPNMNQAQTNQSQVPPNAGQAQTNQSQVPPNASQVQSNQSQVLPNMNQSQSNQAQVPPNASQAQANQSQVPPNMNQSQTGQWQAPPNGDPNAAPQGGAPNQPYGQQAPRSPEAEWLNKKKDSIVRGTKMLIKEIVPLLKRPTEAVRTLAASGTKTVGLELIIINAVFSLIVLLIGLGRIKGALGSVGSLMGADMSINIPWFKAIVLVLCCTLGADCLEAVLLKVFTGVLKGNATLEATFSVVGQKALYSVVATAAAGLFGLLSLPLAWVLISVTNICILVFEFNAYASVVQNTPDRRMYAFMIAKAVITVIAVLLMYLLLSSMMTNMISSIGGSILNSFF